MDITITNNLNTKLEAKVLSIETDFITLEVNQTGQRILWPRKQPTAPCQVGDEFALELKASPQLDTIQSIVSKAKDQENQKDTDQMRKFLEDLIN